MTGSEASLSQQGASMPPAQWLVECIIACVAALVQRDVVAGLREQQRLPRAGNAGADDGNGGIPLTHGQRPALWLRTLVHPCPFAGMTRIRFKGSPRSLGLQNRFERAVSQLLIGAPLGTGLM